MIRIWKAILKYTLVLAVFCGAAGLLLPAVHDLVEPRKVIQQKKTEENTLRLLLPSAESFNVREGAANYAGYYEAFTADKNLAGYVLKVNARGYSSEVEMLVGLDRDYTLTGVRVLAQAETPSLGSRVTEPDFLAQFAGQQTDNLALRKKGGTVDGITGATITSEAVVKGISAAIAEFQNNRREE
ncbi:electron transport complex protein RnfG [Candidatus Termititenax dinenymphae]|uniref:Ion-translocating oxidoreductase complex subunit G n=1 Tax=Candidatus Termititenax dinenymphae TaxID=2218523 RepID=A0A388TJ68_9BACT|nr:electron transport complex protein RnfG [Candidatus Termititenax dinenymphae]